jgi:hypothetical protein
VIVTMNLVNILAALFIFVQCKDPRHLWNTAIPSECWPSNVFTNFSLFVGGTQYIMISLLPLHFLEMRVLIVRYSLLRRPRLCVSFASMDYCLEPSDEKKRKVRCGFCNESRNLVSFLYKRDVQR